MTIEKMTELLAKTEAYFGKSQTDESRGAITSIWANSKLRTAPDDIAEQAFYEVIQHCKWQNQLLPDWLARIQKIQSRRQMAEHCLQSRHRMQKMLKGRAEQRLLKK